MKNIFLTLILLSFVNNFCLADEELEDYETYDSIVGQLSTNRSYQPKLKTNDPYENIRIHAGIGMAMSMTNFKTKGKNQTGFFQGMELVFGIDLFSNTWLAQGSFRNFGRTELDNNIGNEAQLSEFDLLLVYRPLINKHFRLRTSGGIAARYLNYYEAATGNELKYTTPAWAISFGLESAINKTLTLTADVNLRSAMIEETIDDNSFGAAVRLDANF